MEFACEHGYELRLNRWDFAILRDGADLPSLGDINKYFGSWANFRAQVMLKLAKPDYDYDPSEEELQGYSPTFLVERQKDSTIKSVKSVVSIDDKLGADQTPQPAPPRPAPERKKPPELPRQRLEQKVAVIEEDKAEDVVRQMAEARKAPDTKAEKKYRRKAKPDVRSRPKKGRKVDEAKLEDSRQTSRWAIVGIGGVAAAMVIYLSIGAVKLFSEDTSTEKPAKAVSYSPTPSQVPFPSPEPARLIDKAPDKYAAEKSASSKEPVEEQEDCLASNIYTTLVSIIETSRPKSLVPEYNLAEFIDGPKSVQWLINTAFYEGTRKYSDDEEMHWCGGSNTLAQEILAEQWLKAYVGVDIDSLQWHRDEEFTEDFINLKGMGKGNVDRYRHKIENMEDIDSPPANTDSYEKEDVIEVKHDNKHDKAA